MSAAEPRPMSVRLDSGRGAGDFAYYDAGPASRPVDLLFLHANGFNARGYRSILAPLTAERRILSLDLRGHGRTRAPTEIDGRTSWLDLGDDVLAFLEALDLTDIVMAGHSMGGTLSLFSAAHAPGRVRALGLFDPVILPPIANIAAAQNESGLIAGAGRRRRQFPTRADAIASYRGRGAFTNWTDAMLADYVEDGFADLPDGSVTLSCAPEWEVSNYRSQAHDTWTAFETSCCPIRILRAALASTCHTDGREAELTADGRISIETIPGTTHFLPMERPDLVRETLGALLA
jgi:pimeloyl-ACP methyl ester carboxylesterase